MSHANASKNLTESADDIGDQFMLAHFSEMNEDLRHYDRRIETALSIYAAVWALLLAGIITLYGDSETRDWQLLLRVAGVPAFVLFFLGFFTVRRVVNSTISRDRRRAAANLVQHYFTLRAPHISSYLPKFGRTPRPSRSTSQELKSLRGNYDVSFPNGIVHFIIMLDSLLAGLFAVSVASLLFQSKKLFLFLFIFCAIAALIYRLDAYTKRKSQYTQKTK